MNQNMIYTSTRTRQQYETTSGISIPAFTFASPALTSAASSPGTSTAPPTPAFSDIDLQDISMKEYPTDAKEDADLKDKLETLQLEQQAAQHAELAGELRTLEAKLAESKEKDRHLSARYMLVPLAIRDGETVPYKDQASCAAAFSNQGGESLNDVVLEGIKTVLYTAETELKHGCVDIAEDNMQTAEKLLRQVSVTLERLGGSVVAHEKIRVKRSAW